MRIYQHMDSWHGLPVKDWDPDSEEPLDFENTIYRLNYVPNQKISWWKFGRSEKKQHEAFLDQTGVEATKGLIITSTTGFGGEVSKDIQRLVESKDKLPNLRYLFLGEFTPEECEISWIIQDDVTPILEAFPGLEELSIRGGAELKLKETRHICLKKLIIESGGLNAADIFPGIQKSIFPEMEHLEIWAGTSDYGWSGSIEDFRPFLYENPFPKLKYLGLTNSEIQNQIATMAADAPVVDQLETLDLSKGTLRDRGVEALLNSEKIKQLKKLDLSHHYLSEDMMSRFEQLGIEVDLSSRMEADDDFEDEDLNYYIAVGE